MKEVHVISRTFQVGTPGLRLPLFVSHPNSLLHNGFRPFRRAVSYLHIQSLLAIRWSFFGGGVYSSLIVA